MKKNRWIAALFTFLLSAGMVQAQTIDDALRFSQNTYEGTARFQAMGGAFAALGGDFSSLSINPAGIGVYRNFEFMMTPEVTIASTKANYLEANTKDSRGRFGFSNMGVVGVYNTGQNKGLVSFNYGFGYNKLANFTGRTTAYAQANNQTQLSNFALAANGINGNDMGSEYYIPDMAFNTFLIDTLAGTGDQYIGATESTPNGVDFFQDGPLKHRYYRDVVGNVGEYVFTMGGNISNKFYFGMTLGIQSIDYSEYSVYSEQAINPNDFETRFRSFSHQNQIDVSGAGVNLKFGAIYRPVAGLRLAAYIHTPTWMWLTDESFASMTSSIGGSDREDETPVNIFDYRINTPFKWGVGAAYTFGNIALISFDYEGVNYSQTRMYGKDYRNEFSEDNNKMKEECSSASNIRVGTEVRLGAFSLRGGYAFYGSPRKGYLYDQHIGSAGLGYANKNGFFVDAAYSFNPSYKYNYSLYEVIPVSGDPSEDWINPDPQLVAAETFISKIILTLGFRF